MALKLTNTRSVITDTGIKMLVYGISGAGKTTLAGTYDNDKTVIISAEGGMLALHDKNIAVVEIRSMHDLHDTFDFLNSKDGKRFELIVFDSISEIAEVCLAEEKSKVKDGRMAYMHLNETMQKLIRAFRDLPGRHVMMIAKCERIKDDLTGFLVYSPSAPGRKLAAALPYYFDICMALRVEHDEESGETKRYLQTQPDASWIAKDRSSRLDMYEEANLTTIINKIKGA